MSVAGQWSVVADTPADPWCVAVDPRDGSLWIATRHGEIVYQPAAGAINQSIIAIQ